MARKTLITPEVVQQAQHLIDTGMSFRNAAAELDVSTDGIRDAARRYEISLNLAPVGRQSKIEPLLREMLPRIVEGKMGTHEIAKEIGFTQPAVFKALKKMGVSLQPRRTQKEATVRVAERILKDLMAHGGYVKDAMKRLGVKIDPQLVRELAKAQGIDISHYRYANQIFGQWQVQVGPFERTNTLDLLVTCKCLGCGVIEKRSLSNLRSGRTKSCRNCAAAGRPGTLKVKCLEDGTIFNSIRAFAIDRISLKKYQTVRLKLIQSEDGRLIHNGLTYELLKH